MTVFLDGRIEIIENDITRLKVDAIVNAANQSLLGGGGVDGAIHDAAGPDLIKETSALGGCETGQAKISGGYRLPAGHVIHTVGPVWRGGSRGEPELLADCYRNSLELAAANGLKTISFPSISTGAFRYPIEKAAPVALRTVKEFLESSPLPEKVIFCLYGESDFEVYLKAAATIFGAPLS
jgi:O-acetyl-ADP-ribose deacetylase (regulator of RNase III)